MDPQSAYYQSLFDALCSVKSEGLGEHVDLPQIVICGDYAPGKIAILDALGIRAERDYAADHRFFTEIVLRPTVDAPCILVSIIPWSERPDEEKAALRAFTRKFDTYPMPNIQHLLRDARAEIEKPGFANLLLRDTIRIQIHDADIPRLILVDPPCGQDVATSYADAVKERMVQYVQSPRSIVIAIVEPPSPPAEDPPEHWLPESVRMFDPDGKRTIGLLMPPDTRSPGKIAIGSYVGLAKNESVPLHYGWLALAEPSPESPRVYHLTSLQLESAQCGPLIFRERLEEAFKTNLTHYQEAVVAEIDTQLSVCNNRKAWLASALKPVPKHLDSLQEASKRFTVLIRAAIDGNYADPFFKNGGFSVTRRPDGVYWSPLKDFPGNGRQLRDIVRRRVDRFGKRLTKEGRAHKVLEQHQFPSHEKDIRRSDYLDQVCLLVQQTRGPEPAGVMNSAAISAVFTDLSRPWSDIVRHELDGLFKDVTAVVKNIVSNITSPIGYPLREPQLLMAIGPGFERLRTRVVGKVEGLLSASLATQAAAYNSFAVTELVREMRLGRERATLETLINAVVRAMAVNGTEKRQNPFVEYLSPDNTPETPPNQVIKQLRREISVDLDRQAAELVLDYSEAHYQVSLSPSPFLPLSKSNVPNPCRSP